MRLMDLVGLKRTLPRGLRRRLLRPWQSLLLREQLWREKNFYRQFVKNRELVFDIGANTGLKVSAFLKLGAEVVAVEPNPQCVSQIRCRHALAISQTKLKIENVAVGSQPGDTTFHVSAMDSTITSASIDFLASAPQEFNGTFRARVVTADELIQRYGKPAFIKIDVEGMDADVMKGLSERPRALSFEFNTMPLLWPKAGECLEEAKRLQFTLANFSGSGTPRLQLNDWVRLDTILELIMASTNGKPTFGDIVVK